MRRWNGWGDSTVDYPLPSGAITYLVGALGASEPHVDARIETVLANLAPSRLQATTLISTNPLDRLLHARGQSLPDWIALRSGNIGPVPDGVVYPQTGEQVREILNYAARVGAHLIPYGGGTSVVGHINPREGAVPVLTLDLGKMNHMLDLDTSSRLARFEAGVAGPGIEQQLKKHGFTLGHFPQSWEYSTLGGWIATRSTGQQSCYYGRIEALFAGGLLETPQGTVPLRSYPASAAGPDLRQAVLGSEGRLGVITEATVRIRPLPERESFYGIFFPTWGHGVKASRVIAQEQIPVSMIRLSDSEETVTTLALAGMPRLKGMADVLLGALGLKEGRCLMILGLTGSRAAFPPIADSAFEVVRAHGGISTGSLIGNQWRRSRFRSPYLRNTLWERGYALDTIETASPWSSLEALRLAMLAAVDQCFQSVGVPVLRFSHISHVYRDGASLYLTLLYPRSEDPEDTLSIWQDVKRTTSNTIITNQGTISHQHGIGIDHRDYLIAEKTELGVAACRALAKTFDPQGLMNPGKGWPGPDEI